jgi:NADH-quinone oxidoreductase subunit J
LHIIINCVLLLTALSSFFVITVSNPILSLLWLILAFGLSSILFMVYGIEFLSLLIFMIYIGAIAVLFLFVIMMLNIKIVEISSTYFRYLPISFFIILCFFFELFISIYLKFGGLYIFDYYMYINWIYIFDYNGNITLFGYFFYTFFNHFFIIVALILFVSMLGAIVLIVNWSEQVSNDKLIYSNSSYYKFHKIKFIR